MGGTERVEVRDKYRGTEREMRAGTEMKSTERHDEGTARDKADNVFLAFSGNPNGTHYHSSSSLDTFFWSLKNC